MHVHMYALLTTVSLIIITCLCFQDGWSAVMLATKNGHIDIVRYLGDHGSNVSYTKEVSTHTRVFMLINSHPPITWHSME